MKHLLLNCDQVFDVLTRGPFPTGAPDDEGVEHHLRACHECRQLAEALRPAVSLLHEAVAADEAHDLPEYQGSLPTALPWQKRLAQAERAPAVASGDRTARSLSALRLLAASVLAAALALLLYSATMSPRSGAPSLRLASELAILSAVPTELPDGTPNEPGLIRLASFQLPTACLPERHRRQLVENPAVLAAALAGGSLDALRCCTECHHAGLGQTHTSQLAAIIKESCVACHRG